MKKSAVTLFTGVVTLTFLLSVTACGKKQEKPDNKANLQTAIEAVSKNKTPENYLNLSWRYYEANLFEKSIETAQEALTIKPDYAPAYNNICAAYNNLKMWDKGIEACTKGLSIDPSNQLLKNNLAWAVKQKSGK